MVRAHQHAAGARHAPPRGHRPGAAGGGAAERPGPHRGLNRMTRTRRPRGRSPARPGKDREALGRSRGGLTTKVHLLADAGCRPLARVTSAGQRHDSLAFIPLLDRLRDRPPRAGTAADQARPGPGRQGLLQQGDPLLTCDDAVSRPPSPSPPTRSAAGSAAAARAAGRPHSTPRSTSSATPSSAPSAGSASTAPSPPGTTSATSSTAAPSMWQRSGSGSATSHNKIYGTRPSRAASRR